MFKCERCGACCRSLKCKYLLMGNYCTIYDTRPDVCRVDVMTKRYGISDKLEDFSKQACTKLRDMEMQRWLGL
jgi:Fe-S-cluster containining protein